MAHNLMVNADGSSAYYGRQSAWHGLGEVTGKFLTADELLDASRLGWGVEKRQLLGPDGKSVDSWGIYRVPPGDYISGADYYNILKDDVFLGEVGARYQELDHRPGFRALESLVSATGKGCFESAGALGKGERVWGLINLGWDIGVGEDRSDAYLAFSTAHDGTGLFEFWETFVRIVCENTFKQSVNARVRSALAYRHTKNAQVKIDRDIIALQGIKDDSMKLQEKLEFLASRKLTRESTESIFDRLFPKTKVNGTEEEKSSTRRENILAQVLANYEENDGNAFPEQRGTPYAMWNAITNYVDHSRSTHGEEKGRLESATFGSGAKLKEQAFEVILESAAGLPEHTLEKRSYSWSTRELPDNRPIAPVNGGGSLLDNIISMS